MEPYTIGVEEEYQLVDPETGGLLSRARDVLAIDWTGETEAEVQETQVEIATRVCGSAAAVDSELRRLRFHAASAAAARDLVPVAAGLHPFSDWREHEYTSKARYLRLLERYGRVIESEHVFGMHVHVEVPEEVDRLAVIGRMRRYLPHLLALSASSPYFLGGDTGYASYRTVLNERLPCSGAPPAFGSEAEYWAFTAGLIEQGVAVDEGTIYWTVRPHHRYPTIEIRCADVCPAIDDAVAIAALARAVITAAAEESLPPDTRQRSAGADAALAADQWQAARFGLEGRVRRPDGGLEPLRDAVLRLLDDVGSTVDALGDAREVEGIPAILERGNGATRMREVDAEQGGLEAVLDWLARETVLGTGMDRRRRQRNGTRENAGRGGA
ncbi:MAG: YbdK family carboxylate-amine ligase [Gemmatimonadetes bacterium]|nr:YbdK family carboxylate-amine ligase [Gemmatimonadota bacterium]